MGGVPKNVSGIWHDVLKMTEEKQKIFMDRIMFLFEVTKAKAGKAQVLRLSLQQWLHEAELACLAGHCIMEMSTARNADNLLMFNTEKVNMVRKQIIEGSLALNLFKSSI